MSRAKRLRSVLCGMRLRAHHTREVLHGHPDDFPILRKIHHLEFVQLEKWARHGYWSFKPATHFWKGAR